MPNCRLQLSEPTPPIRYLGGQAVTLSESANTSLIEIIRTGTFQHAEYGEFNVTGDHLDAFVRNFATNAYGQDIFVDVGHKPQDGAAAKIIELKRSGNSLKALVQWTPYGVAAIRDRNMIYLSADYCENWVDNETGKAYGPTLLGAGLVTRPHIKRMQPVQLAEASGDTVLLINPTFLRQLSQEATTQMDKYLKLLIATFANLKLSDAVQTPILAAFKNAASAGGFDDAALKTLSDQYQTMGEAVAKQLEEAKNTGQPVSISVGMTETQVKQLLEADRKTLADQQTATAKRLSDNQATFTTALAAATGLSDDTRKTLSAAIDLITGDMTEAQVKRLAEFQVDQGNKLEASRKLSDMGFHVQGSPRITVDETNNVKSLAESVRKSLMETNAYGDKRLTLAEKAENERFVNHVLAEYDRQHHHQLQREHRILAGSETNMGSAFLPASFQREVIREALADLNILQLVRTAVDPAATVTTQIPYEERTTASSIPNGGTVYEGQGINFAGVGIKHDIAYVGAVKLALKVTNEVMHFSQSSGINWNAWGENIASNARIIRELIHLRVANEMQRASDSYMAVSVVDEAFTASATGLIKTAQFPIVRPQQQRDLQGNAIGNAECPLTLMVGSTAALPFTGEKDLPAGTYWVFSNINMGYIQLVDQVGAPAGASAAGTISYSKPTNLIKFDLNPASGVDYRKHLNNLLSSVGDQKAMLTSQRYSRPEYALMSAMLNNEASKADQFVMEFKRNGTNDNVQTGDLESIKGLPSYDCNAPGMDIGDQRILIGQRGLTGYTIIKPYSVGQPFEAVDNQGRPTGEKVAYGEEYNALHTPRPVRNRYTSVLVYDSTTR